MADAEGAAPPPQQRRRRPAQDRLLEVETLEQRDDAERDRQAERELPRTPPPRTEIEGDDDQRDAEWDGQSVEHRHDLHGLEPEQEVVPPRDVRRQRRGEVEQADGEGRGGRQGGQVDARAEAI